MIHPQDSKLSVALGRREDSIHLRIADGYESIQIYDISSFCCPCPIPRIDTPWKPSGRHSSKRSFNLGILLDVHITYIICVDNAKLLHRDYF